MAPTGLLESFVAAIQASLSVLFVIFYGGIAAWMGLLSPASTRAVSKVCVRMFLPALLFVQIGSELHAGSAARYLIILGWAILTHLVSFLVGVVAHLGFGMPDWTTVSLMFNNTTSYPLLLIAALNETGILSSLMVGDEDPRAAIERAKSYFLVFATVSSCLTFAVGPRLIDSEHAPEHEDEDKVPISNGDNDDDDDGNFPVEDRAAPPLLGDSTEETGLLSNQPVHFSNPFRRRNSFFPSKRPPIEPRPVKPQPDRRLSLLPQSRWDRLGPHTKWWLLFLADFFNAPLLGAIVGAVVGLIPALHTAFFADTADGGIFTAWLTASLKSIGSLFVPLPVVIAGVSLYTALKEARQNRDRATEPLPRGAVAFILMVRFVIWPAVSISVIYALAARTSLLGADPMMWFAMMLMPAGPPAMKLITLVQVSDAAEGEESNIAKLLTICYVISPILSLTVVGALKASQACIP